MKKIWLSFGIVCFATLPSLAGILKDFDIKVAQEQNSLVILANAKSSSIDFVDIVNIVLQDKLETTIYANNISIKELFKSNAKQVIFKENGSHEIIYKEGYRISEFCNFFNAPLVLKSNISPEQWIKLIEEELEQGK